MKQNTRDRNKAINNKQKEILQMYSPSNKYPKEEVQVFVVWNPSKNCFEVRIETNYKNWMRTKKFTIRLGDQIKTFNQLFYKD